MSLVLIACAALAAEPEPTATGERPLAIPSATPAPGNPPAAGGNGERAAALRTYGRRHLAVHSLAEFYATPSTTTWWGGRWGWATTSPGYLVRDDTWSVYEGEHRLDVPTYLGTIGDDAGRITLERKISSNRTWGTVVTLVGVSGLGAAITGLVGMEAADTFSQVERWSTVSLIGLGTGVAGLVIGAFPSNRARSLRSYPDRTLDRRQVESDVDAYNERLATELGLSPEAAVRVEQRRREDPR